MIVRRPRPEKGLIFRLFSSCLLVLWFSPERRKPVVRLAAAGVSFAWNNDRGVAWAWVECADNWTLAQHLGNGWESETFEDVMKAAGVEPKHLEKMRRKIRAWHKRGSFVASRRDAMMGHEEFVEFLATPEYKAAAFEAAKGFAAEILARDARKVRI